LKYLTTLDNTGLLDDTGTWITLGNIVPELELGSDYWICYKRYDYNYLLLCPF